MINWLLRLWYARQRDLDIDFLWPTIREQAYPDLIRARAAFAIHAHNDRAWLILGSSEIERIVKDLY